MLSGSLRSVNDPYRLMSRPRSTVYLRIRHGRNYSLTSKQTTTSCRLTPPSPFRPSWIVTEALAVANRVGAFDLVLYNAGMDPSDIGVSQAQLDGRERMAAEWAGTC